MLPREALFLAMFVATSALTPTPARAGDGLLLPAASEVWPQWQARVTLQAVSPSPLSLGPVALMPLGEALLGMRNLQAGALLGDYVFASPRFGQFRATSGVLVGSPVGASPLAQWVGSPSAAPLGWSLQQSGVSSRNSAERGTQPYLGLGFTGSAWLPGLSLMADLGLVSENFSALGQWARAASGNASFDQTLREMRWSPVLQVGLRYAF